MTLCGKTSAAALCLAALAMPQCARAAPANTFSLNGEASAVVAGPSRVFPIRTLRFGNMMSPSTAGTIVVSHTGTITSTGGATAAAAVPQPGAGRGPARFRISGMGARFFIVRLPKSMTLTSGAATMAADTFTMPVGNGAQRFDATGQYLLDVGATLRVNANQAGGHYAGTFQVTVIFQ